MPTRTPVPLGIYYEHPDWFRPLFQELDRRGVAYDALDAGSHHYDPAETSPPYAVLLNRVSPSAFTRRHGDVTFYTAQFLAHLERLGTRVINGEAAWRTEISKAYQLSLLERLGLPFPKTRVIHESAQAVAAAAGLRFPVVVKPNTGGSGAGIRRYDSPDDLAYGVLDGDIDLGVDRTALVQEHIPAEAGRICRVEVLDSRYLYAIRVYAPGDSFNLCPADICRSLDGAPLVRSACPADAPQNGLQVEGYTPPPEIVAAVERIMALARIELGGVEYLVDARDGQVYFYDINALSNFVADAPRVIGFDPFARLADWLEAELARARASDWARPRATPRWGPARDRTRPS
jgi:hypothetical protein